MNSSSPRKRIAAVLLAPAVAALFLIVLAHNSASAAVAAFPQGPSTEIIFGKLKPFTQKSGWFTISIPENWTINDVSSAEEAVVSVMDPTKNAALIIRANPSKVLTQPEMAAACKKDVQDAMGTLPGFTMGDATGVEDGSVGLVFHFNQALNNQTFKMYGLYVMKQNNGMLGTIMMVLPQDQYDARASSAYEVIGTFRIIGKPKT